MSWFTELEDLTNSIVEYIPVVGTVYSIDRAIIAHREHDWMRHWQSVGNFLESIVRDVVLYNGVEEITTVAILHTMAESFTDKMIEIYHHQPNNNKPNPRVEVTEKLVKKKEHVLVIESSEGKLRNQVFGDKAKGVHHFYGAMFIGTLTDSRYARDGEKIRLDVPHGLYDGARVTFSWKWTQDSKGVKNRPEFTLGRIKLVAGTPTEFKLSSRKGSGGWEGYDFKGEINSKNQITATTQVDGREIKINFGTQTRSPWSLLYFFGFISYNVFLFTVFFCRYNWPAQ